MSRQSYMKLLLRHCSCSRKASLPKKMTTNLVFAPFALYSKLRFRFQALCPGGPCALACSVCSESYFGTISEIHFSHRFSLLHLPSLRRILNSGLKIFQSILWTQLQPCKPQATNEAVGFCDVFVSYFIQSFLLFEIRTLFLLLPRITWFVVLKKPHEFSVVR